MAIVGPSDCGKTELIFRRLRGSTFYPRFKKVLYLYKEMHPISSERERDLGIEFKKFKNLEFFRDIKQCLLIFDDSCDEIFNYKEFVKIATAGRHENIDVIYVRHNLYQQSKWSRTIDLNTTHIILFKSPRDIQQVAFLGKLLNLLHFLRDSYRKATENMFGHLLIDLDPKTSDCLRYCSNITKPGPTIFFFRLINLKQPN